MAFFLGTDRAGFDGSMSRSPASDAVVAAEEFVAASVAASRVGVTVPDPAGVSPRGRSDGPAIFFHSSLGT